MCTNKELEKTPLRRLGRVATSTGMSEINEEREAVLL